MRLGSRLHPSLEPQTGREMGPCPLSMDKAWTRVKSHLHPRQRSGSYVSVGSNAEDMEVQEEESGGEPLCMEDLEVRESGSKPTDKAGDNREETVSLDSSVHSHKEDESDSSKQVEGDAEWSSKSQKKDKAKKKKKSKEGKQQRENAAGQDSESRDDSRAVSRHQPSA